MTGNPVDTGAILAVSITGMTAGDRLPERFKSIAMQRTAVTTTGGLMITGIGINLPGMARIPVGYFLPALLYGIVRAVHFSG